MRLIDADALKPLLREYCVDGDEVVMKWYDIMGIDDVVDRAPTIDAVPRWIPCEERLPEPNVAVLGYAPTFNNIYAVYYDSDRGWMTWGPVYDEPFPSFQGKIVAWMPMPAPYEGERRDDE